MGVARQRTIDGVAELGPRRDRAPPSLKGIRGALTLASVQEQELGERGHKGRKVKKMRRKDSCTCRKSY